MDKTGSGYGEYLIRYYEPEPEPQPVPEPQVQPVVVEKSQMDIMKEIYCNNRKEAFWKIGYFISTTGGANIDTIRKYIERQQKQ
jgi:REP element-mobilizing transposase RayT